MLLRFQSFANVGIVNVLCLHVVNAYFYLLVINQRKAKPARTMQIDYASVDSLPDQPQYGLGATS